MDRALSAELTATGRLQLAGFVLDLHRGELWRADGQRRRVAQTVARRAAGAGRARRAVVTKEELMRRVMAIDRIGPTLAAQTGMVGPMSTLLMGIVILGEPFTAWVAAGTVLVLMGIWRAGQSKVRYRAKEGGWRLKTNYVLVDYENVQPPDFDLLLEGPFKIKVFLGAHQSKLPRDLVKSLQAFGDRAEYIDLEVQGKNALDFHIAYFAGRVIALEPDAYVHVISRDKDIELLFPHLRAEKVNIGRYERIADIPLLKPLPSSHDEQMQLVVEHLERLSGKPRTLKALEATIGSVFRKGLTVENVASLIKRLELEGYARVVGREVEYGLPLA